MDYLILQVEEEQVTVARFCMSGRVHRLDGAALFELGGEQSLDSVMAKIAAGTRDNPRVILCLPPAKFAMRTVMLPFDDLRKAREILPLQLQGELTLPVEELSMDVLCVASGEYLAIWAKKSDVRHAVETCRTAGIEPQIVTSLPFAAAFTEGVPADTVLYDGSALTITRSGKLSYFSALDLASASMMFPATLAAVELAGSAPPPCICLIGPGSSIFAEAEVLTPTVKLLQAPAEGTLIYKNEETFQQLAGLYAVARASQAGQLPDFRRGELAWTAGDAKIRKKLLLTSLLVATILLILFGSKIIQYRSVNADIASLNRSIADMYREVFPNRPKAVDELSEVRGEMKKLAGADSSGGYLDLLKKLAEAKGNTINGLFEAEVEGRNLRIKGDARSTQAVNEFKTALMPLLATAELGEIKSRPDGSFSFSLTGTLKEGSK